MIRRLFLASLLLSACFYKVPTQSGTPISADFVQSMVKGKTTMEEVRTALGNPQSTTVSGEEVTWTFTHWKGKPAFFGSGYERMKTESLIVTFKNGKLLDYSYTTAGS